MLTTDLVRVRIRKGELKPVYLDPSDPQWLELAGSLIELFQMHLGRPYGELREATRALVGDGPEALPGKGLVKLLEDRAEIAMEGTLDPREVRKALFEAAARRHPVWEQGEEGGSRGAVMREVAAQLGTTAEVLESAMYADLPDAHVVQGARLPEPSWLIDRYNVGLAQAILLRASSLTIELRHCNALRLRQFFRYLRFFRLMHRVTRLPEGYQIEVDGPLSLFRLTHKYGLQLAELLPALLLVEDWRLTAHIEWGTARERRVFKLSPEAGLRSHYPDTGVYETREEVWFRERFAPLETPWRLEKAEEVLRLGEQEVVCPDFALRHPDGRVAWLELVGFWRRGWLERRLSLYREKGPGNLILAVSRQLQGCLEELEGFAGEVSIFREVLMPKDILARAERVGRVPEAQEVLSPEVPAKGKRRTKKVKEGEKG